MVIKGGHLQGGDFPPHQSDDYLFQQGDMRVFPAERVETRSTHGTGCTLSAAICVGLGQGLPVEDAVARAKEYLTEAIKHGLALGHGHGPADHFYFLPDRVKRSGPAV